ncbi:alpha/beta fold hydrolase [Streptomyces sp. NPDC003077]|uniref:alpha/beta fold hydrolase n=1 Tax=Streptomyces sp. NPDC003077 TaxID=3154443 RepID=UPI0033B37BDF
MRTHFLQAGQGRPVLLVHGEGTSADPWVGLMRGLAPRYRTIAVDLPGNGRSEPLARPWPTVTAGFLWHFLKALGIPRAAVVGHSLGGAIAVHMARQRPARVPRLTLISSTGMGRAIEPVSVLKASTPLGDLSPLLPVMPLGPQLLVTWLSVLGSDRPWCLPPSWWHAQTRTDSSPQALATALRTQRHITGPCGQRHLVLGALRKLTMPTLVIWGTHDRVLPPQQARKAFQRLPDARLVLLPGGGHLLPAEAPDRVLRVLTPFLR